MGALGVVLSAKSQCNGKGPARTLQLVSWFLCSVKAVENTALHTKLHPLSDLPITSQIEHRPVPCRQAVRMREYQKLHSGGYTYAIARLGSSILRF